MPDEQAELDQIERAVSDIVAWASRPDVQEETMRRARCDLPRTTLGVLGRLDRCAPARLSDLAGTLGLDASTLSPQVQRLERDGLVLRGADPNDGRAALLRVTRTGRALLARMHAARREMLAELVADWTPAEHARAATALTRLAATLDRLAAG